MRSTLSSHKTVYVKYELEVIGLCLDMSTPAGLSVEQFVRFLDAFSRHQFVFLMDNVLFRLALVESASE